MRSIPRKKEEPYSLQQTTSRLRQLRKAGEWCGRRPHHRPVKLGVSVAEGHTNTQENASYQPKPPKKIPSKGRPFGAPTPTRCPAPAGRIVVKNSAPDPSFEIPWQKVNELCPALAPE